MDRSLEKKLNKYLKEIEVRLEEISFAARKEFIAEIRSHLLEKWESSGEQNEENLLRVISEFRRPGGNSRRLSGQVRIQDQAKRIVPPNLAGRGADRIHLARRDHPGLALAGLEIEG